MWIHFKKEKNRKKNNPNDQVLCHEAGHKFTFTEWRFAAEKKLDQSQDKSFDRRTMGENMPQSSRSAGVGTPMYNSARVLLCRLLALPQLPRVVDSIAHVSCLHFLLLTFLSPFSMMAYNYYVALYTGRAKLFFALLVSRFLSKRANNKRNDALLR